MDAITDLLRGELERLFDLDEMKKISADLLGLDPEDVGGTAGKGAFSRSLVERCAREDALEALADAIVLSSKSASPKLRDLHVSGSGAELAAGTNVAGFRVIKKLGEGGVGVVYLAERKEGENTVKAALKVVKGEHARDRAAVRRFLTGTRVLKTVKSPALAQVLATGELEDGRPWVATVFVDGQTLAARVGRVGPMHFNEARPIVISVLDGLVALHARGLVHGDVKAENVFVVRPAGDGPKEPLGVLTDGGADRLLARGPLQVDRTGTLPVFGTAKAIAPEVTRTGHVDARSDVYAFGALLFEALTGKPPFGGDSGIDVVLKHLSAEPAEPSKVAPRGWVAKELDEVVLRCLAKSPDARFQSAAEVREALESIARASRVPTAPSEKKPFDEKAYDEAVELLLMEPGNEELAVGVEKLCGAAGMWAKAVEAFDLVVAEAEDEESKKGLLFRVARIQDAELDSKTAAEAAYHRILELDPEDEIAQIAIEELKRASGDNEGLVDLLLEKVERTEGPSDRAKVLHEIATLYEEALSQPESALVAWVQALTEDASDEKTTRAIERLCGTDQSKWNDTLQSIGEAAGAAEDITLKAHLFVLAGRWYDERLARPDFAVPCFSQALAIDPANEAALDGTIGLYRKAQAWPDLVQILLRRADAAASPAKTRDVKVEAAEVIQTKLGDAARAAEIYKAVLADDPTHEKAALQLEEIYTASKDFAPLVALLEKRAESERGAARVETLAHIAELYEDRLDNADKAAAQYEAVLALDPKNLVALKGLERLYARGGKYTELLGNLRAQIELTATPRQKIGLLERIGGILEEEFVDAEKAAATFEEIVAIDGGHDGANGALARLYRQLRRFTELADTLERHAGASTDDKRKVDLLATAAKVLVTDVGAPERALSVCERILTIQPKHTEVLELVARLKTQSGDAHAALQATEQLARDESDPVKKAELYVRAGRIAEDKGDADLAIEKYKAALDSDAKSKDAASSLRAIYAKRGDAHGAADLLKREIGFTDGAISKSKLWAELGVMQRDRLQDEKAAKDAFLEALALDGTSTPSLLGLGAFAFSKEQWADAAKYLEPLLARTSDLDKADARDACSRAGHAFRKLGQFDKAQRAYLNAKSLSPDDREILERVADVTYEGGASDEAAELYKDLLDKFGAQIAQADRGRILVRVGEAQLRSGEHDAAIKALNDAAHLLPTDAEPLEALTRVYEGQTKWEEVVATLKRRIERADSDALRYELHVRSGDVLLEKLKDKNRASKAYVAALEIRADDRNLLTKLMAVYSESKDWSRLVEVILRIAELVSDPKQLGKYFVTAAGICQTELLRHDEAADYYEQALEHDPLVARAFEGLVACVTQRQDWFRLEEVYRKHLVRVDATATPEQKAALHDALGEVLQHRLKREADAVEQFEQAQKLDPENRRRAEMLAEVYTADPKRWFHKAIKAHANLLEKSPYRVESYKALRSLYTDLKKADESWCVCQVLRVMQMAEPDEESFFKKHRSRTPAAAKERFDDELWAKHVVHHQQDPLLTVIFATIAPAVIGTRSQPLASFGVDASKLRNPEHDSAVMAQTLHYAGGVLDLELPAVYTRDADAGGLSYLFSDPPAIGLGRGALAGGPPQALAFVAARHLSYVRGGHYLRHLVPTGAGLRAWLLAAIRHTQPGFPVPGDLESQIQEHIAAFKEHLTPPVQEVLKSHVHKLLSAAPELNLKRWVAAVDLTADRVGFILANDLELSLAVIRASPEDSAGVGQKDRLKELHLYAVSEEYLALRYRLGIAIGD